MATCSYKHFSRLLQYFHDALRASLAELVEASKAVSAGKAQSAPVMRDTLRFLDHLHGHHTIEDHVRKRIRLRRPGRCMCFRELLQSIPVRDWACLTLLLAQHEESGRLIACEEAPADCSIWVAALLVPGCPCSSICRVIVCAHACCLQQCNCLAQRIAAGLGEQWCTCVAEQPPSQRRLSSHSWHGVWTAAS